MKKTNKPSAFAMKVYDATKLIPKGKVSTYKLIAQYLNSKAFRVVGTALHNNPYASVVPCHRVVNSNGNIGGFASGKDKKIQLLLKEGVKVENDKIVNFQSTLYKFGN